MNHPLSKNYSTKAVRRAAVAGLLLASIVIFSRVTTAQPADTIPPATIIDLRTAALPSLIPPPPCVAGMTNPMINSLGVTVASPVAGAESATIRYRQVGQTTWKNGHRAIKISTGNIIGSIFWLSPATSYDVEVTVVDATNNTLSVNQCTVRTLPETPNTTVATNIYVSASAAPGGDGSVSAPFKTIQAGLNLAQAGDQITVQPGVYFEKLTFPRSGASGAYIKIVGLPGAILRGSDPTIENNGLTWTPDATYPSMYSASLTGTAFASAIPTAGWRDTERSYHYSSLSDLQTGTGRGSTGSTPMAEGWFADNTTHTLHVRSLTPPASHTWHLPTAFAMATRVTQSYLWFEGLTFQFYNYGSYIPKGSQIVFRNNTFQVAQGVQADSSGGVTPTDIQIEGNTFADAPIGDWAYVAVKGTNMETAAITFYQGRNIIIRDNRIEQFNNGIQPGGAGAGGVQEADVYRNIIRRTSDDGMELDGSGQNLRVWGNAVDHTLSALSLAPISVGPTWVLNNRFTNFSGRGYKLGDVKNVFIYHNTAWTDSAGAFGTQEVAGTEGTDTVTWRNNIYRTADLSIRWTSPVLLMTMDYDNVFSTSSPPIYWSKTYATIAALCSAVGQECHGIQADPQLVDPNNKVFGLAPNSPNIDTGVRLPGINDVFSGTAPDRGYVEQGQTEIQW